MGVKSNLIMIQMNDQLLGQQKINIQPSTGVGPDDFAHGEGEEGDEGDPN